MQHSAPRLSFGVNPRSDYQAEAVNIVLAGIGQTAVMSLLSEDGNVDSEQAIQWLDQTQKEFEEEGWHHNTDKEYVLDPAPDGSITLPSNVLKFVVSRRSRNYDLVDRGGRLYWRTNATYTIGASIYADLVRLLEFEELPQAARWYVTVKAARRFATHKLNSAESYQFTKLDEDNARSAFERSDAETDKRTMKEASPFINRMRPRG